MKLFKRSKRHFVIKCLCCLIVCILPFLGGCFRYGFSGASIPEGVKSIYIPFFPNNSSSSVPDISNKLKQVLINRFVNKSPLHLAKNQSTADAVLTGSINGYSDKPFSISGESESSQNQVTIQVKAKFKFSDKDKAEWNKSFSGTATYDPTKDPIQGETDAAIKALDQVANNMFNDAVSGW